uniref:Phospholipase A2 inhibitor subunit gamma B-like n=1 Tax=Xenopus tropicalis TaxID=8364 RepID=A0A803J7Y5_XENTR
MSSTLAPIYTLLAFVATGYSLTCTECLSWNGMPCSGTSVTCSANEVCASLFMGIFLGTSSISMTASSCAPKEDCGISGSLSFPSSKTTFASSCCSTDYCTPAKPALPDIVNKYNGLTCPACVSVESDQCDPGERMLCTGNENMCYWQTTVWPGVSSDIEMRGCATKSVCDLVSAGPSSLFKPLNVSSNSFCTSQAFPVSH